MFQNNTILGRKVCFKRNCVCVRKCTSHLNENLAKGHSFYTMPTVFGFFEQSSLPKVDECVRDLVESSQIVEYVAEQFWKIFLKYRSPGVTSDIHRSQPLVWFFVSTAWHRSAWLYWLSLMYHLSAFTKWNNNKSYYSFCIALLCTESVDIMPRHKTHVMCCPNDSTEHYVNFGTWQR